MGGLVERIKSIPMPLWIGGLLVIVAIIWMSRKSTSGAITSGTVGTQGSQGTAAADQMLGTVTQSLQANQAQTNANFKSMSDTFTSGLQQITALEAVNNKALIEAGNANTAAIIAGNNANTAAISSGLRNGFQQIVDLGDVNQSKTTDNLNSMASGYSSGFAALGAALQALKNQMASMSSGVSAIQPAATPAVVASSAQQSSSPSGGSKYASYAGQGSAGTYTLPNIVTGGSITVSGSNLQAAIANAAKATGVSVEAQARGGTYGLNSNSSIGG